MKKPVAPCKGCEEHDATCKLRCDKWKEYERANAEYREAYKKYANAEHDITGVAIRRSYNKTKKWRKR